jgi:sphingomyelin phosphodiesterase
MPMFYFILSLKFKIIHSWLLLSNFDPAGELMWLAEELLAAEQAGQKVHIISHIPGNGDCYKVWGNHYRTLINRSKSFILCFFFV